MPRPRARPIFFQGPRNLSAWSANYERRDVSAPRENPPHVLEVPSQGRPDRRGRRHTLAGERGQPFDAKAFQASQAAGKSILVDITASWCPTCKQQKPIVQEIEKEHLDLVVYDVDFDTAKDVLRQLRVQHQSTLIVFKGQKEVARSTGETDPAPLRSLVAKAF